MGDNLILSAAWIAPMTGPPLRDSGVLFREHRIAAIGPIQSLRGAHPDAEIHDLGNAVILPGLVNAHTHLELSSIRRGEPPSRFVDWLIGLMGQSSSIKAGDATREGIRQCLRFGVTTVGDITSQPLLSRGELGNSSPGGISYGEVRAMGQRRGFLEARIEQSRYVPARGNTIQLGISPHAPYSIEIDGYRRCLSVAKEFGLPLATHLAETPDESQFLSDHTGPFKELWDYLSAWDENVPRFVGGPIRFAKSIGLLDYPTLLAHVNYCDNAEMDLLANGIASVVCCPRTHAFFGHPPHRWREMLSGGINVAVGTDSCASSPDLNLVDDLRLLHEIAPEVQPLELWRMATSRGAKALGLSDVGTLSLGNIANAVVFRVKTDDPLREIIEQPVLPWQVWALGQRVLPERESAAPAG